MPHGNICRVDVCRAPFVACGAWFGVGEVFVWVDGGMMGWNGMKVGG